MLLIFSALILGAAAGAAGLSILMEIDLSPPAGFATLSTIEAALFALSTFLLWPIALWAALRLLHRRGLRSLLGPAGFRMREWLFGAAAALFLSFVTGLLAWMLVGAPIASELPIGKWLRLMPLVVVLLFVQTAAEELLFRGYLTQQLAARFRSPIAWALAPSLLFGLLHWNPAGYGPGAWMVLLVTAMVGLALTAVTARTGGLSAAMGLHFGVNASAILFISPEGYFSSLALAHWRGDVAGLVGLDLASVIVICLLAAWIAGPPRAVSDPSQ
ncbi:MAG: CPBP family intramembrane glutamic endopeptidase [Pseudomonadota bacterium]